MSINLLPNSQRRLLLVESYFVVVFWIALLTFIGLATSFTLSFITRSRLTQEISSLEQQKAQGAADVAAFDTVAEQAQVLATDAAEYNQLIAKQRAWVAFFAYLTNTIPPNVYLTAISTANERGIFDVVLNGTATDKTAVGLFREKILAYEHTDATGRQRVSQAIIDAVSEVEGGGQTFTLRLTVDLQP